MMKLDELQESFNNKSLFDLALTHKSWVNEHPKARESNERLEFLGDAVLEFVVSKRLFTSFPKKEEGFLTALRANLVNTVNLAEVARKMKIGKSLYLSKGEEEGGGRDNPSLLANTIEALIGAIFIDGGINSASEFIEKNILNDLEIRASEPLKDAKSMLQEIVQAQGNPAPKYNVVEEKGPDHAKKFTIEVLINGGRKAVGKGKNKGEAAQDAAKKALEMYS